ncbi:MAG: V-type ATP synthase subunit I [Candidatus Nanohaloarchaea archaeon]
MKPAEMTKISITGHRKHLHSTVDALYELNLLDVETYTGEMETGNPFEGAEEYSEMLVEVRSLLSSLPEDNSGNSSVGFNLSNLDSMIEKVKRKIESLQEEEVRLKEEKKRLERQGEFLEKIRGCGLTVEDLDGTRELDVAVLDGDSEIEDMDKGSRELFEGKCANVLVYRRDSGTEELLDSGEVDVIDVPEIEFQGTVESAEDKVRDRINEIEEEVEDLNRRYRETANSWRPRLEEAEEFLNEKVEKAEAPLEFATTDETFIAEGWIPDEKFQDLGEALYRETDGRVHIQEEEAEKEPPTKHENIGPVKPFESLTDLVSVPRHNEIDPSAVLMLTFPLFFGFMIGDAGYGLTTLAVFFGGYKLFPEAKEIFQSLMYASVATFAFGLAFGDAFGFVIFGHHSELAAATGVHLFEKIPILFHRAEHLGQVFNMAAVIGFAHVNLGYLIGFYNEFTNHGLKDAFLEKISWLVLEIGALAWFTFGFQVGAPILLIAAVSLYVGEGIEGIVEIPSLLANILSYLRLFGVSVAAVALAAVVNAMAKPLFSMGGITGFLLGTLVLVIGHVFNTFIKIMEGFLQGIRLHYVEMFSKFYEGGGRKYAPFGAGS